MKQLTIRAAVCSALLAISSLANANNINFTNAADSIISAELAPLFTSYEQEYGNSNWSGFPSYVTQRMPEYQGSTNYTEDSYLVRPVALSELSNTEVSFTNTSNLGIYSETINRDYETGSSNYSYAELTSFGQNGFTAGFTQPVSSVSMDFALTNYFTQSAAENNWNVSPYEYGEIVGFLQQTPIMLNATYKDASGQIIGSSSVSTPFNLNLINGGQLNNPGFSLDGFTPFSSVDISWDSGFVSRIEGGDKYDTSGIVNEVSYSNLLTANNFTYTQAVAVPEPETYAMMMAGLGMLGFTARRKKAKHLK